MPTMLRPTRRFAPRIGAPALLPPAPAIVTGVTANRSTGGVNVGFTGQVAATSYNVYRSVNGGAYSLHQAGITSSPWEDTDAEINHLGDSLGYKVSASNVGGEGPQSTAAVILMEPPAPVLLGHNIAADGSPISLLWDAANGAALVGGVAYRIRRRPDAGAWGTPQELGLVLSFDELGTVLGALVGGDVYGYEVAARNASGWGEYSNEELVTAPPEAPARPYVHDWVYDTSTTPDTITVQMRAPGVLKPGSSNYQAQYRDTSPGEPGTWETLDTSVVANDEVLIPATDNLPSEHRFECRFLAEDATNAGVLVPGLVTSFNTAIAVDTSIPRPADVYGATTSDHPTDVDANINTSLDASTPDGYPSGVDYVQAQLRDVTNNGVWTNVDTALGPPVGPATYRTADLTGYDTGLEPGVLYDVRWVYAYTGASQLFAGYPTRFQILPTPPAAPVPDVGTTTKVAAEFTVPAKPPGILTMTLQIQDAETGGAWGSPVGSNHTPGAVLTITGLTPSHDYATRWYCTWQGGALISDAGEWSTLGPGLPDAPGPFELDNTYGSTIDIILPDVYPNLADELLVLRTTDSPLDPGAVWDTVATILPGDFVANAVINDTGLSFDTTYWYKLVANNGTGEAETDAVGEHTDLTDPPNAPLDQDAPLLISKANDAIVIGSPAWVEDVDHPVVELRLYRMSGSTPVYLATWVDDTGEYTDTNVTPGQTYEYRVRAFGTGASALSDPLTVELVSDTATLLITEPLDGATLHGIVNAQMTAEDVDGITEPLFLVDGLPLEAPTRVSGTPDTSSQWRRPWDTRESLQGTVELTGRVLGSDGLYAFDTISVTLANTPANGVLYLDAGPLTITDAALAFRGIHLSLECGPLSANTRRRWRVLAGLRGWNLAGSDPLPDAPADTAEALAQWADHQRIDLRDGKSVASNAGGRPERHTFWASARLNTPAQVVMARLQLNEAESALAWSLAPSTSLTKARSAQTGSGVIIFGTGTATVWEWDGTSATMLADLSTIGAGSATDGALLGDKVYAILGSELRVMDTTGGDRPYTIQIRTAAGALEPRAPLFVERIGSAVFVICGDSGQSPKTQAYKVTGGDVTPVWTLADLVTRVDVSPEGVLGLGVGTNLYRSSNGTTEPTLVETFAATITALDQYRAALSTGAVMAWNGAAWVQEATLSAAGQAVGAWEGSLGVLRGVAVPVSSAQLVEQDGAGAWAAGRLVANPTGTEDTVEAVLALRRYASGSDEALLALTSPDGLLIAYRESTLDASFGAVELSSIDTIDLASNGSKEPII